MKSQVFQLAHLLFKSNLFTSFGAALKAAWVKIKIKFQRVSVVTFQKEDGSIRTAEIGSAPADYQYKGSQHSDRPELVKYWDAERGAFRSFRLDRLVF